jgi:hypothetical protein
VYGYGTRQKLSFSLGKYTTVFQAEVYATKACTVENKDRDYINRNIKHLTITSSKLVWNYQQSLMKLGKRNKSPNDTGANARGHSR